jgi:hypothetical protein
MKYLTHPVMACVPFRTFGAPTPSGPLAIESKIPGAAVRQNLLLANTCILHSGRIVPTPGRSFFGAGSAESKSCWYPMCSNLQALQGRAVEMANASGARVFGIRFCESAKTDYPPAKHPNGMAEGAEGCRARAVLALRLETHFRESSDRSGCISCICGADNGPFQY